MGRPNRPLLNPDLATAAAKNYVRTLRKRINPNIRAATFKHKV